MYDVDNIACIYSMENIELAKMYIGNTKDLHTRLAQHIHEFKTGIHYNRDMQADFDKGAKFHICTGSILCNAL